MKQNSKILSITLLLLLLAVPCLATIPQTINFQGRLDNANGVPMSGIKQITFSLYAGATSSPALWNEQQSVTITKGVFSVVLGSITPIPASAFNNSESWIGITVAGDAEMTPRQQISSVGYAFKSSVAESVPPGSITSDWLANGSVTSAKLGNGQVTAANLANGSVTASKIGVTCADGEVLRYDARSASWSCSPTPSVTSSTSSIGHVVGAMTITGVTETTPSNPYNLNPYRDVQVYDFEMELSYSSGVPGIKFSKPVRVICDPKKFAPALNQASLAGTKLSEVGFWFSVTNMEGGGRYSRFINLSNVWITGQRSIPPTRSGDPTLVEYTFTARKIDFYSPSDNTSSSINFNGTNGLTVTGCSHPAPVFALQHGLSVGLGSLGAKVYLADSYSTTSSNLFGISVSGPLDKNDGPCFMIDVNVNQRRYPELLLYTIAAESAQAGTTLLESRIRLDSNVTMPVYRLYMGPTGRLQQDMTFAAGQLYWGFYPYNAATGGNDPIIEKGWDLRQGMPL